MPIGTSRDATIRPATAEDAQAVVDLYVLADIATLGEPSTTIDEVHADLEAATVRSAVLTAADGDLLGYAWLDHQPGHSKSWGDFELRPGSDPQGATAMVGWLTETARELAPGLPLHTFSDSQAGVKRSAYEAAGGTVIRNFFRMAIPFDRPVPAPELGPGVAVRKVEPTEDDLRTAHRIADTSFADHFGHEAQTYETWLGFTARGALCDLSLWWFATVDGEPAAVLYAAALPNSGHIDTLGTLREHRGRGLGRTLLLTAFAEIQARGLPKATLGVDSQNPTGALQLYESVGMRMVNHGMRYELRP